MIKGTEESVPYEPKGVRWKKVMEKWGRQKEKYIKDIIGRMEQTFIIMKG